MTLTDDLLAILREKTSPQHNELHHHPVLEPLTAAPSSVQYADALRAFYAAYSLSESRLYSHVPDFVEAPVLMWLAQDLKNHNIAQELLDIGEFAPIDTPSKAVGYAYVKQGSTLGGRAISRNLGEKLGLVDGVTNCFFAGYGAATGERWKHFQNILKTGTWDHSEACAQAIESFDLIKRSCDAVLKGRSQYIA